LQRPRRIRRCALRLRWARAAGHRRAAGRHPGAEVGFGQRTAIQLACGGEWQLVEDDQRGRHHVRGEESADEFEDGLRVEFRARRGDVALELVARVGDGARWRTIAPGVPVHAAVPVPRPARLAWEQVEATRLARRIRADVWHGPHYTMPVRAPVPAVVTIHDMTFFDHPEWHERAKVLYFRQMMRVSARRAAALVCVSGHTANRLREVLAPAATHHSTNGYPLFVHFPGFRVAVPSHPADAKGLLTMALRMDDPVLFLEHKSLLGHKGAVPAGEHLVPFGQARIVSPGQTLTVVAIGIMVPRTLGLLPQLAGEGISVELIDPRTVAPLDLHTILASVRKTGRLLIIDEAYAPCGIGAEIAAQAADQAFDFLDAPIRRLNGAHTPTPYSPPLERAVVPGDEAILSAIRALAAE
ncbi:MAG: glycosyltransferase, partial [Pirellulales bacterium]|nr:glycosyltransferase [Pirellulales bacterium]